MSTAAVVAQLAEIGAEQVGIAALEVGPWIILALGVVMLAGRWALGRHHRRTAPLLALPPAVPCPCCTGRPMESDDCTCREDCGSSMCQAAEERPECPWCDTHECIDRTLCNCRTACGSWLCIAKEASR